MNSEQQFPYGEVRRDLEDASKTFCQNAVELTSVFHSPITQQYLKGVLENMQSAHQAVQDKIKLIVPLTLGSFAATCLFAYFAFEQADGRLRVWLFLVTICIS